MASYVVDIGAKMLAHDHEVYVARPGRKYRFYLDTVRSSVVYPEFPFLDFRPGVPLADQTELTNRIRRSIAIRRWHGKNKEGDVPGRSLAEYHKDKETDALSIGQLTGVLRGYFERAKKGDLVLVPPSLYSLECFVGEFTTEPHEFVRHKVEKFGNDPVTARPVKWLAQIPKRKLPTTVIEAIEKPTIFFLLDRPSRKFIYEKAYGSYNFDNDFNARFDVSSLHFKTSDDFLIQAFFNFVTANTLAVRDNHPERVKGFNEAIFVDLGDAAADLRTNVNSPGSLNLTATNLAPIVASVLLIIAVQIGPAAVGLAEEGRLKIGNVTSPAGDPCTAMVEYQVMTQLKLLGLDKWPEACEKARLAEARTGLKGRATIKEEN